MNRTILALGLLVASGLVGLAWWIGQNATRLGREHLASTKEDAASPEPERLLSADATPEERLAPALRRKQAVTASFPASAVALQTREMPAREKILPPAMERILAHWTLLGVTENSAILQDESVQMQFEMRVGEFRRIRVPGWLFEITLEKTDTGAGCVFFKSDKHAGTHKIAFPK